jgi:hypothetical protein
MWACRRSNARVAERGQHELQRLLMDRLPPRFIPFGQIVDQLVDRLQDWVQRILVAGQDHPARHRPRAARERIERHVDYFARILVAGTRAFRRFADLRGDRAREMRDQRFLQVGGRAEMVQQVGMRPPNPRRHRL